MSSGSVSSLIPSPSPFTNGHMTPNSAPLSPMSPGSQDSGREYMSESMIAKLINGEINTAATIPKRTRTQIEAEKARNIRAMYHVQLAKRHANEAKSAIDRIASAPSIERANSMAVVQREAVKDRVANIMSPMRKDVHTTIEDVRKRAHTNYETNLFNEGVLKIEHKAERILRDTETIRQAELMEMEQARYVAETRASAFSAELNEALEENNLLRQQLAAQKEKTASLQALLLKKEEKLRLFKDMDPVFTELREKLHFSTVSNILERISGLESTQIDAAKRAIEAEAQAQKLRDMLQAERVKSVANRQKETQDLQKALQKAVNDKQQMSVTLKSMSERLEDVNVLQARYLHLVSALSDLYSKWEIETRKSRMLKVYGRSVPVAGDEQPVIDRPDMNDPFQILRGLDSLITYNTPDAASAKVREHIAIANSLWLRYLSADEEAKKKKGGPGRSLRGNSTAIFNEIRCLVDSKDAEVRALQAQLAAEKAKTLDAIDNLKAAELKVRRLEAELSSRNCEYRERVGDPNVCVGERERIVSNISRLDRQIASREAATRKRPSETLKSVRVRPRSVGNVRRAESNFYRV